MSYAARAIGTTDRIRAPHRVLTCRTKAGVNDRLACLVREYLDGYDFTVRVVPRGDLAVVAVREYRRARADDRYGPPLCL
ncbi:hypothetical protein B7G54_02575 [Burkholderia puraquae]|uniref:Uncharacterized protein n=1 Tax=Burkholderia puraquae TaxID=1904757 RepID=A0A1X1PPB9_9BURK|nr:hypothetical protein B7G54_02575 [Burkholderia puraquae]